VTKKGKICKLDKIILFISYLLYKNTSIYIQFSDSNKKNYINKKIQKLYEIIF